MSRQRRWTRLALAAPMVLGSLLVGSLAATPAASAASGGVVTFAEAPQAQPDFIFPFSPPSLASTYNSLQFQELMFRPLYWFGQGTSPAVNPSLSLAKLPVFSDGDTVVTLNLKNYKWSDGETVTADDVLFFMNILHAEYANYAQYNPGDMPQNIKSVTTPSSTQVVLTLTRSYNPAWFLGNQLTDITPFPLAWDKSSASAASGSGGCATGAYGAATTDTKCTAVYTFLSNSAGYNASNPNAANDALPTYDSNPLWQVVDGPYRLTHYDAAGNITMVPNPDYSGPIKPVVTLEELPFTSDSAEYNDLVGGKVDVGFLPTQDITKGTTKPTVAGPNNPRLVSNFTLHPLYVWGFNFFPYNFKSTGDGGQAGAIFSQLYIRQAFQSMIDQPLYISRIFKGYGIPTFGPIPTVPSNPFIPKGETNPYPYNPSKAKSLLTSHGWKIVPGGTDTCTRPGTGAKECGAGIKKGAKLSFSLQYAGGVEALEQMMDAEKSSWSTVGISVGLSSASFNTVIGNASACPKGCSWQLENWGGGLQIDAYPSGEGEFLTNSSFDLGLYSNPKMDADIEATLYKAVSLDKFAELSATDLPVVYEPAQVQSLVEIAKNLRGVTPLNAYTAINPENWRIK